MTKTFTQWLDDLDTQKLLGLAKEIIPLLSTEEIKDMYISIVAEKADCASDVCPSFKDHIDIHNYEEDKTDIMDYQQEMDVEMTDHEFTSSKDSSRMEFDFDPPDFTGMEEDAEEDYDRD